MLMFDIGANRGDATLAGLQKGYKVVAVEPGPKVFKELVTNFIYNKNVIPLKLAVSDIDNMQIEFYEAKEDGLSSINIEWLTNDTMPYAGKPFRVIYATTITIDSLVNFYGQPDLIKIDVEGSEWKVFNGMSKFCGKIAFEWTDVTIAEHQAQIKYLSSLGYTEIAFQFIEHHLQEPKIWYPIKEQTLEDWIIQNKTAWIEGRWKESNLRPTADVGMCWIK